MEVNAPMIYSDSGPSMQVDLIQMDDYPGDSCAIIPTAFSTSNDICCTHWMSQVISVRTQKSTKIQWSECVSQTSCGKYVISADIRLILDSSNTVLTCKWYTFRMILRCVILPNDKEI